MENDVIAVEFYEDMLGDGIRHSIHMDAFKKVVCKWLLENYSDEFKEKVNEEMNKMKLEDITGYIIHGYVNIIENKKTESDSKLEDIINDLIKDLRQSRMERLLEQTAGKVIHRMVEKYGFRRKRELRYDPKDHWEINKYGEFSCSKIDKYLKEIKMND